MESDKTLRIKVADKCPEETGIKEETATARAEGNLKEDQPSSSSSMSEDTQKAQSQSRKAAESPGTAKSSKKTKQFRAMFFKGSEFVEMTFLEAAPKKKKLKKQRQFLKSAVAIPFSLLRQGKKGNKQAKEEAEFEIDDKEEAAAASQEEHSHTSAAKVEESDNESANDSDNEICMPEPGFVFFLPKNAKFYDINYMPTVNATSMFAETKTFEEETTPQEDESPFKEGSETWYSHPNGRCLSILQEIAIFQATFRYNSKMLQFRIHKLQEELDNHNNEVGIFLEKLCNEIQLLQSEMNQ